MPALNFIFSSLAFLLLLFGLHLFFARLGNPLLNRLFAILLFSRVGQIIVYVLVSTNELDFFPLIQQLFTPLFYAAPACFYLYISRFIDGRKQFRKSDWIHTIPVILAIIHVIPWSFSPAIDWNAVADQILVNKQLFLSERTGLFPAYFCSLGRPALEIGYLLAAWYVVLSSELVRQKLWDTNKLWIFFCLIVASIFKLVIFLPMVFDNLNFPEATNPSLIFVKCLVLLFVITVLLQQPRLLYGYLFVDANWKSANAVVPEVIPFVTPTPLTSSPKSNLSSAQVSSYTKTMNRLMEKEKLFLIPDLQISHLAQKLDIPVHQCSYLINNVIGKNFRDWINAYRIQFFISNYPDSASKMTIEAIANQSGFKSMATFYNAFKKETGLMPKAYFLEQENKLK